MLAHSPLSGDCLASGELMAPSNLRGPAYCAYYRACLESPAEKPPVPPFRTWPVEDLANSSPLAPPPEAPV